MYNSQFLDTKRVSTTWKLLLTILSITFVWQSINTSTYANVLPKSVHAVEPTTQKVTTPTVISKEVASDNPTTQKVTTPTVISKEVAIEKPTPEIITTTPVISKEVAIENPTTEIVTTPPVISKEVAIENPTTEIVTTPPVISKEVAIENPTTEIITTTPVISKEVAIENPTTEIITTTPVISKEVAVEQKPASTKFLSLVETGDKIQYSDRDLFCLAKNIYHEARGEPIKGRYAVAQVTINRTQNRKFSGSICDVVFAPYQFSWANNRRHRWTTPQSASWKEARQIAIDVLENGKRVKGMEEALYFHAKHVNPGWRNVQRLVRIGSHIFYE